MPSTELQRSLTRDRLLHAWRAAVCHATRWWTRCPFCPRVAPAVYVHYSRDGSPRLFWRCKGGHTHRWPAES